MGDLSIDNPGEAFKTFHGGLKLAKIAKKTCFCLKFSKLTIVEDSNSETGNSWQLISTTPAVNNMMKGNDSTEEP